VSPIRPEKRCLYPENWVTISKLIRERAGWKCGLCRVRNGDPHPVTGSAVILTVHHINGDPTDMRKLNLLALCQRCHNKLDQPFRHARKVKGELI
jgi:5-methylcytosine-specific restriction endonuclease McrA